MLNSRRFWKASFSAWLALALAFPLVSSTAFGRVIPVGPSRELKTIPAAIEKAVPSDEIVLDQAEYAQPAIRVVKNGLTIRSAEPAKKASLRSTSTAAWPNTIEHEGDGLILKDLILSGGGGANITGVMAKGRHLTVDNVVPAGEIATFLQLRGATDTVLRNVTAPKLRRYTVCSFDDDSRGLLIERCTFAGSLDEHCIRLQRTYDAVIRDCTLDVGGWKSALTIRDGANNVVERCTINGPIALGPLADGDGGINYPTETAAQRARRDDLLRRSQKSLTIRNCTIKTTGIDVEMGVSDLIFESCHIATSQKWALRLHRDEYEPWRNVPTGKLVNCDVSGPSGVRIFDVARPTFAAVGTSVKGDGEAPPEETEQPEPTDPMTPQVPRIVRMTLVDAATLDEVRALTHGDVLRDELLAGRRFNVRVWTEPVTVGSVRVILNGVARLETAGAYTVADKEVSFKLGDNVIEAIPYATGDGSGTVGESLRIVVVRETGPPRLADVIDLIQKLERSLQGLGDAQRAIAGAATEAEAVRRELPSTTQPK